MKFTIRRLQWLVFYEHYLVPDYDLNRYRLLIKSKGYQTRQPSNMIRDVMLEIPFFVGIFQSICLKATRDFIFGLRRFEKSFPAPSQSILKVLFKVENFGQLLLTFAVEKFALPSVTAIWDVGFMETKVFLR